MDLRINRLEINNFKGIKHQVLELGGKNTLIKGQNGAGKSTCGSALGWIISDTDIELLKRKAWEYIFLADFNRANLRFRR